MGLAFQRFLDNQNAPEAVYLRVDIIRMDGGTQPRANINDVAVEEYAQDMRNGDTFPPIEVMYDGTNHWLIGGFHRVNAAKKAGIVELQTLVRQGTLEEARWLSIAENATHGLRRTTADKQRAIESALLHSRGQSMSDRAIAMHLHVDHKTVGVARERLQVEAARRIAADYGTPIRPGGEIPHVQQPAAPQPGVAVPYAPPTPEPTKRIGADGKEYDVAKIREANKRRAEVRNVGTGVHVNVRMVEGQEDNTPTLVEPNPQRGEAERVLRNLVQQGEAITLVWDADYETGEIRWFVDINGVGKSASSISSAVAAIREVAQSGSELTYEPLEL